MYLSEDRIDKGLFSPGPGSHCGLIHNDHLATPQKMTDASGTVVWSADYKPFGEVNITTNTITNNLRFPGQYFDAETGLNYNYYRDYNPVIGRYIEKDPIGLRGGINLYLYAAANSLRFTDPFGLLLGGANATIGPAPSNSPGSYIGPTSSTYIGPAPGYVPGHYVPVPPDTPSPPSPGGGTYCGTYSRVISVCADAAALSSMAATALSGGLSSPVTGAVSAISVTASIMNGMASFYICGFSYSNVTTGVGAILPGWWGAATTALDAALSAHGY